MIGTRLVVAALLLALTQIGFLSWMIAVRAAILRNGTEVLLKVEPVDPRDLLRGDYVRLGYEISTVPAILLDDGATGDPEAQGLPIFVRVGKDNDGFWRVRLASMGAPSATPREPDEIDLKGTVSGRAFRGQHSTMRVDFGIDRFYLPEGEGQAIEANMRLRSFGILAAVGSDGTPQIRALMDGDKKLYEEPLY